MHTIKIVNWPDSQVCIGCPFGEFVQSKYTLTSSNYICHHPKLYEQTEKCGEYTEDDYYNILLENASSTTDKID